MNGLDRWAQYNYFWDVIAPNLKSMARQVWLAVFRHSDTFGRSSITRSRIADMLGTTPKSVSEGIKELKAHNLIEKTSGQNGYIIKIGCNIDVTPCNATVTPPCNPDVTPPVTPALHITEASYRTDLQNTYTEEIPAFSNLAFFDEWNDAAKEAELSECLKVTQKRKSAYKARAKDSHFNDTWRDALDRIKQSDFCRGRNERGWKADVDWFLRPDTIVKIMEGKYDNPAPKKLTLKDELTAMHNLDELD